MQCEDYLDTLPGIKRVETEDTAKSAQWIADNKLSDHAAVCSKQAAELFGLEVLAEGIETNRRNFTRFLAIADSWVAEDFQKNKPKNKSSLVFLLPHTSGSLSKALTILSFYDMNLSKIQSMPIIGREWEYKFYVDLTFDDYTRYKQALDAIIPLTKDLKILGEYAEGKQSV
jgi:prephenate dehydratase